MENNEYELRLHVSDDHGKRKPKKSRSPTPAMLSNKTLADVKILFTLILSFHPRLMADIHRLKLSQSHVFLSPIQPTSTVDAAPGLLSSVSIGKNFQAQSGMTQRKSITAATGISLWGMTIVSRARSKQVAETDQRTPTHKNTRDRSKQTPLTFS